MYSSVLLRAVQKMDRLAEENKIPKNLRFLCVDARNLNNIFDQDEIDKIYLNFSDPWPKDRHAKRRLPSKEFLSVYRGFLKKEGREINKNLINSVCMKSEQGIIFDLTDAIGNRDSKKALGLINDFILQKHPYQAFSCQHHQDFDNTDCSGKVLHGRNGHLLLQSNP